MAGVAGPAGPAGEVGPQGPEGATGAQGPAGVVAGWTLYREFQFDANRWNLQASQMSKVYEITRYMKDNPSLKIGIDGSMDPRGTEQPNQELCNRRAGNVRDVLIQAGVPEVKISVGSFRDTQLERDGEVAVLIRTGN
jgi:outer membrane protein OmpA-like peptidoglycan-associated protein